MTRLIFPLCLALAGCPEVSPTNAYDPNAPVSQQEKSVVRGIAWLPADITLAGIPAGAVVELVPFGSSEAVGSVPLTLEALPEPATAEACGGEDRLRFDFVFEEVAAGLYFLRARALGFTSEPVELSIAIGEDAERAICLALDIPDLDPGRVVGNAQLEGGGEDGHEGIRVAAVGVPGEARTDPAGDFVLPLPTGVHALRFSYPDYEVETVADVEIIEGVPTELDPVVLVGAPGGVRGRVAFPPGIEGAALFAQVEVLMWPADEPPEAMPSAAEPVTATGAFSFEGLPAGDYRLLPTYPDGGFESFPQDVTVPVGAIVNVGVLPLFQGETRAWLDGTARLAGANEHGGIRVEALGVAGSSEYTGDDGRYELELPPGEWTLRYTYEGYGSVQIGAPPIDAGARETLEEVVLTGEPGRVRGAVTLEEGATPEELDRVVVCLLPIGVALEDECAELRPCEAAAFQGQTAPEVVDEVRVGTSYLFEDVPVGPWLVVAQHPLACPRHVDVVVVAGEDASAQRLTLPARPDGVDIRGFARLGGVVDHGGIEVRVDGQDAVATTLGDGQYTLTLTADPEGHTLRFSHAAYISGALEVGPIAPGEVRELPEADAVVLVGEPGRVAGVIRIDPDFAVRDFIPNVVVRFYAFDAEGNTELIEQINVDRVPRENPDDPQEGRFAFDDVDPGRYQIEARLEGFLTQTRLVEMAPGGDEHAGTIFLSRSRQEALLLGAARLDCVDCSHEGIRVEAVGTPFTASTSSDGRYQLSVIPGAFRLRFAYPGHGTETTEPVEALVGEPREVADVVLSARPGEVRGQVVLPPGFDAGDLLPEVSVTLTRDAQEVAATNLVDDVFIVGPVPPGEYTVHVRLAGFIDVDSDVTVQPGERLDLRRVNLVPVGAETVSGRVTLEGVADPDGHGGVEILVVDTPFATRTLANGDFMVQARPGDVVLHIARVGYVASDLAVEDVPIGGNKGIEPFTLNFRPATVTGTVRRVDFDEAAVPAAGATATFTRVDGAAPPEAPIANDDGVFTLADVRGGAYDLRLSLAGHATVTRRIEVPPGAVHRTDDVTLDLLRGAIEGTVERRDGEIRGGVTVHIARRPNQAVERTVLTRAPDDAFELPRLPVGSYDLHAFAEGYTPADPVRLEVAEGGTARIDLELDPRVYAIQVQPLHAQRRVPVTIQADDDLAHYRLWLDAPAAPPGAAFENRPAGPVEVDVPEGAHVIYVELATTEFVQGVGSADAFITPAPLAAAVTVDSVAPSLRVTPLPQPGAEAVAAGLYVRTGEGLFLDLGAHDPPPSSGVDQVRIERLAPAGDPATIAYQPRVQLNDVQQGANAYRLVVTDAAGNESAAVVLDDIVGDAQAPRARAGAEPIEPVGGAVTPDLAVELALNVVDPDEDDPADGLDWPLFYRVHDAEQAPGGWQLFAGGVVPFNLRGGADGQRTITGAVKDAAGRVFALNETVFVLDRVAAAPTAVSVRAGAVQIVPDSTLRLEPDGREFRVDVTVQVAGADERLVAHLAPPHAGSCEIDGAQGASSCEISDVLLPEVEDGQLTRVLLQAFTTDAVENTSARLGFGFTADNEAPRAASAQNTGDDPTRTTTVTLRLDARDATHYAVSGDVNPIALTEAAFPVEVDVTLAGADGDKTVRVDFQDGAGNLERAELSLRLDRAAPVFTVQLRQGGQVLQPDGDGDPPRINSTLITVRVLPNVQNDPDCRDAEDCAHAQRVSLSANFEGALFEAYNQDVPLELPPVNGLRQVFVQMRDPAGNLSVPAQVGVDLQVEVDREGPAVPGLRRDYIDADKIRLELTPPGDDDLAYYVIERNIPGLDGNAWATVALTPAVADDEQPYAGEACAVQPAGCAAGEPCLAYDSGGEVLLLEDRAVVRGFTHQYRVRAVDTLGNASGFSVPLEAGVPMDKPQFSLIRAGDLRKLQWSLPEGTFVVDRATYQELDPDGVVAVETDVPAGPGQFALPPADLEQADIERFVLRTANQDRSMIWESTVLDLGIGRRSVGDFEGGSWVRAQAAADGTVHVAALSDNGLGYVRIAPDGTETRVDIDLNPYPTHVLDVAIDPIDGTPLVLTWKVHDGHLRLYRLGDPTQPVTQDLGDVCDVACFGKRVWGGLVVDEAQTAHIGYFHPEQEALYYRTLPDDGGGETVLADNRPLAGRDVRMALVVDVPTAIYVRDLGGQEAILTRWVPDDERGGVTTDISGVFKMSPFEGRRMLEIWSAGVEQLRFAYTGRVDNVCMEDPPQPCADNADCGGTGVCVTGGLCSFDTLGNCNTSCGGPCRSSRRFLRMGEDRDGLQPELQPYVGAQALRAPQIERLPGNRVVITAATTSDPNYLYIFAQVAQQSPEYPAFDSYVMAEFSDDIVGSPSHALTVDGLGRPRIFVNEAPQLLTELTADFVLENPAYEYDEPLTQDGTIFGEDLAAVRPAPGIFHAVFRDQGELGQDNLYYQSWQGQGPHLVAGPDHASEHQIGRGLAIAAPTNNQVWMMYAGGPNGNSTDLFLKSLSNREAAPIQIAQGTDHPNPSFAFRSQKKLVVDDAGTMHSAWIGGNELHYWTRDTAGEMATHSFGADVYNRAASLGRTALPVIAGNSVKVVSEVSFRGLVMLDVTDPANPGVQEMVLGDGTILDAEYGSDQKVWVVYRRDTSTYLAPFGGTPTLVSTRIRYSDDDVDLVVGEDGALHLFYTETKRNLDGTYTTEMRYQRPLANAEPTSMLLDTFEHNQSVYFYGIDAWPTLGRAFTLFYADPSDGSGEVALDRRPHRRTVRPGRAPGVTYARADGLPTLGADGDADEDGIADGGDNCPGVWNPNQGDVNNDGTGDLCSNCFANCANVPEMADVGVVQNQTITVQGSTIGAGANYEGSCGNTAPSEDAVYAYTSQDGGDFIFDTQGSGFDTTLYLLDDCDPADAEVIECDDDGGEDLTSVLAVNIGAGDTVYVVVDGFGGANGDFTLRARPR